MPRSKRAAELQKLSGSGSVIAIDDLVDLLNSPRRIAWLRFYSGVMAGAGGVVGAAAVLILLGLAARYLGGIPWIGHLFSQIRDAARSKTN